MTCSSLAKQLNRITPEVFYPGARSTCFVYLIFVVKSRIADLTIYYTTCTVKQSSWCALTFRQAWIEREISTYAAKV